MGKTKTSLASRPKGFKRQVSRSKRLTRPASSNEDAASRTSPSLVVTGTTDRIRKNAVNIRSVLTQKITIEKRALARASDKLRRMEAALEVLLSPKKPTRR